jgi:hypothetical protein
MIGNIRTIIPEAKNLLKDFTSGSGMDFETLKQKT